MPRTHKAEAPAVEDERVTDVKWDRNGAWLARLCSRERSTAQTLNFSPGSRGGPFTLLYFYLTLRISGV